MLRLLVTDSVVPRLPIVTLMMEAIRASETSVLIKATLRHSSEDVILQKNMLFPWGHFHSKIRGGVTTD
jgi:hypothetical protein